jgi:hypothetical protein
LAVCSYQTRRKTQKKFIQYYFSPLPQFPLTKRKLKSMQKALKTFYFSYKRFSFRSFCVLLGYVCLLGQLLIEDERFEIMDLFELSKDFVPAS